ncbi:UDP-N-acetylglucosamine 1-carboxyvinyltransferase [Photobacterium sp. ZSDE20]|uniref:UDP-N-acetylglucosamine 1-carboxyvinyltransferase n=1 Tax=Photobacterium pectinilyticum TaxID=2906793 RepID=A0ABT1N5L6_9GAMM|nr:UDP-N-acetylglucosamine 1-carboxyvinyltransferase [Photobacterium sp. ZSDE20]MCQ1060021.1 UDP-N-acetylglucosamine 1-carboxyvinyltransferase [Photobacterium sp. ZSDE20]MDD1826956.1 UDP-N-acetylglucosamine 1-carboxyvinyltransferase [Photobacterium sp. ZSDE20]
MMYEKKIVIEKSKLEGTVKVSGAKNSVLRLLAASILFDENVELTNYPSSLLDVRVHEEMLEYLGKTINVSDDSVIISQEERLKTNLEWHDRSIRNTLLILGASVAKYGYGRVPLPGGCKLGERKYDIHVNVLESLGAKVYEDGDYLVAESDKRLQGCDIHLRMRSTGATENAILAGSLAEGVTRIYNPHIRPEIIDLIDFLNKSGAKIKAFGQERIEIQGVQALSSVKHKVMPDNMEALTWVILATMTKSEIKIENFPFKDLEIPLIHLRESGVNLYRCNDNAIVAQGDCYPIEISTGPYPGINSDMQPLFAAFAAMCKGTSHIIDLRFPGRYAYGEEMKKMNIDTSVDGDLFAVSGSQKIIGAKVKALDLRAGIALLMLGMTAEGQTVISDSWQIKRGYNNIIEKLCLLGANVKEV